MLSAFLLTTVAVTTFIPTSTPSCRGISDIERATMDTPIAFASLREQSTAVESVRNAAGQRVQREVAVTNVKALQGFDSCRFVYSASIDLACYVENFTPSVDADGLELLGDHVGGCLTNPNLRRSGAEQGSTPSIIFGGGASQPFWQISWAPKIDDPSLRRLEVLVLGPAIRPARAQSRPSAQRKRR